MFAKIEKKTNSKILSLSLQNLLAKLGKIEAKGISQVFCCFHTCLPAVVQKQPKLARFSKGSYILPGFCNLS